MKRVILLLLSILFVPMVVFAQANTDQGDNFFKAKVLEIIEEQETVLPDGVSVKQQNVKLLGLEGIYKDKEIIFYGIGDYDVLNKNIYSPGNRVLVIASFNAEGEPAFYITDYVRGKNLLFLLSIFVIALILISGFKGMRALLALALTFIFIIKFIIPKILLGSNPLAITLIGSFIILLIIIYITEGFCLRSHISAISIFLSLVVTIFLSWAFVSLAKLTGVTSEEVSYLINIGEQAINFKGLLLAGVIIGALGVLDDVVISQVSTVEQIFKTNSSLGFLEIFKRSYKVGVSHIASMTNTLFLAYAGVSLPLLILFVSGESAFSSWSQIINNEAVATEIVRALTGSIGIILSVPVATIIASWCYKKIKTN